MARKRPRGDATPGKKFNGEYMPVPYGPRQNVKNKKKDKGANAILRAAGYGGRKKSKRA